MGYKFHAVVFGLGSKDLLLKSILGHCGWPWTEEEKEAEEQYGMAILVVEF